MTIDAHSGAPSRSNFIMKIPSAWLDEPMPANASVSYRWDVSSTHAQAPRSMRMPLPFSSITDDVWLGRKDAASLQKATPKFVSTKKEADVSKEAPEERVLISEVDVVGVEGELKGIAQSVLKTRPNFAYTISEVKQDVQRIFNTGWFRECIPDAIDTRDGVKLVIKVIPNDQVKSMTASGANALPNRVVQSAFRGMHGKTLNFVSVKRAVNQLDQWYSDHGVLGQVTDFNVADGRLRVECAEAVVGRIDLNFIDPKTELPRDKPSTRPEIIMRHLVTQPGKVYSLVQAKRDIASIYSTGLFEDVNIAPKEAEGSTEACPKIDLAINLLERKTGGMGAGGGLSAQATGEGGFPGFVGSFSYSEKNLFGLNQKLSARVELGQIDKMFQVVYTDPWLWGDKHRTSRTISLMNNRTSGAVIHGRADSDAAGITAAPAGSDVVMLSRLSGGLEFQRPLSAQWSATVGAHAQRTNCIDEHGGRLTNDCYGAPLTFSGRPDDSMVMSSLSTSYSNPDDDSQLLASVEQSVSLRRDWLRFTRLRLRADKPLRLVGPVCMQLRARGGHVYGDLPPYEAFPIGGTNSVRGYAEGSVGSGRSWVECSSELRFPVVSALGGSLFFDYGTDLDSGASVIGDPAGARNKPGSGYGFGAGVRVDTPVGPLRLEYAWNDKRVGRFHVGVGND